METAVIIGFDEPTQTLLDQLDLVWHTTGSKLASPLDDDETDLLSLFVQREITDVTHGYAENDLFNASQEAQRALRTASLQLSLVSDALSTLPASSASLNCALIRANDAYCGGEACLHEKNLMGMRGDTLADYIVQCISTQWMASDGFNDKNHVMRCVDALDHANTRIRSALRALDVFALDPSHQPTTYSMHAHTRIRA